MGRAGEVDARIGRNLRTLRMHQEWEQEHVAVRMQQRGHGWVQQTVSDVERGRRGVLVSEALALADLLRIEPSRLWSRNLLGQDPEREPAAEVADQADLL